MVWSVTVDHINWMKLTCVQITQNVCSLRSLAVLTLDDCSDFGEIQYLQ